MKQLAGLDGKHHVTWKLKRQKMQFTKPEILVHTADGMEYSFTRPRTSETTNPESVAKTLGYRSTYLNGITMIFSEYGNYRLPGPRNSAYSMRASALTPL